MRSALLVLFLPAVAYADRPMSIAGEVIATKARWTEDGSRIVTDATVRTPDGDVVVSQLGGSVGRPAETIVHTTLTAVDPAAVDMLATVLVGASTTRRFTRGDGRALVYTPRGYAARSTP